MRICSWNFRWDAKGMPTPPVFSGDISADKSVRNQCLAQFHGKNNGLEWDIILFLDKLCFNYVSLGRRL